MAARFTAGNSMRNQPGVKNTQLGRTHGSGVEPPKGRGPKGGPIRSNNMQGMPGYIKTAQDKSSSGLANPRQARGGQNNGPHLPGPIPSRKGEPRRNWQSATSTGGSQDKSYSQTSGDKPGVVRVMGQPKAPAKRSNSEMEVNGMRTTGSRSAVSKGGATGANRLPAGGIAADKTGPSHKIGGTHRGLGSANASGQRAAARGGWQTAGTMERLKGQVNFAKTMGNGFKRAGSKMY